MGSLAGYPWSSLPNSSSGSYSLDGLTVGAVVCTRSLCSAFRHGAFSPYGLLDIFNYLGLGLHLTFALSLGSKVWVGGVLLFWFSLKYLGLLQGTAIDYPS